MTVISYNENKKKVTIEKSENSRYCPDCGSSNIRSNTFHHGAPSMKDYCYQCNKEFDFMWKSILNDENIYVYHGV